MGKLDETEEEKKKFSKLKDMYKPLTDWWKEKLTDLTEKGAMKDAGVKIEKVELSKRLTDSPVVVVTSQFGYSAQQEKIMKAQAFQNKDQIGMMSGRKTLEVNANHPVIADASFTVVDDPRGNTLGRGSRVTLHLKEDAHDYLSEDKLKETAKKYSQFIQFPIYVKVKKEVDADAEEDDDDDKEDEDEEKDDEEKEDEKEDEEEKKPKKKT